MVNAALVAGASTAAVAADAAGVVTANITALTESVAAMEIRLTDTIDRVGNIESELEGDV